MKMSDPSPPVSDIAPQPALQPVVAQPALQDVGARQPAQRVVAVVAGQPVGQRVARQGRGVRRARLDHQVLDPAAGGQRVAAVRDDRVGAGRAGVVDDIGVVDIVGVAAFAAVEDVGAVAGGDQDVVAAQAIEVPAEVVIHQIDDRVEIDLTTIEPTVANVDENLVSHDDRVAGRPRKSKTTSMQSNFTSVDRPRPGQDKRRARRSSIAVWGCDRGPDRRHSGSRASRRF